jgi:voltage-gated sodium channel type II alpha
MSEDLDSISEEERSLFRPFTRESLAAIEARIAEEHAKQKELEKKRAEGEVSAHCNSLELSLYRL